MPFAPSEKQKKKFSLTEFEDKRRRHCAGRMCMNVLYFLCTMLMIIVFIGVITDVWSNYNTLVTTEQAKIDRAKQQYSDWCKEITPFNEKNCTEADNLRN